MKRIAWILKMIKAQRSQTELRIVIFNLFNIYLLEFSYSFTSKHIHFYYSLCMEKKKQQNVLQERKREREYWNLERINACLMYLKRYITYKDSPPPAFKYLSSIHFREILLFHCQCFWDLPYKLHFHEASCRWIFINFIDLNPRIL